MRFAQAVERSETIAILGDYDVDGACAAALLLRFLRGVKCEALLYVPDRLTEGYGPSVAGVRSLRERGASLLVTVDCGAAAHDAMQSARDCGLDAIVLDHHAVETNPPAFAHVNPNGPDDRSGITYVCAAGLAFLFLVAVQRSLRERGLVLGARSRRVGPSEPTRPCCARHDRRRGSAYQDQPRLCVRQGLRKLERLARPGLAALARLASATPPFSPFHLGFIFGPRINAGGRVGRCDLGARLLASDDIANADSLALEKLDRHNRERQAIEAHILEAADAIALSQSANPFLLVSGDGWHAGVVGIVAGRLRERHAKPALVAGFDNATPESVGRGSARSVAGVDLGAIIRAARAQGILETGGGHAMAAGFSVHRAKLDAFHAFLAHHIEPQRSTIVLASELIADAIMSPAGANLKLLDDIERAGPYGAGNPGTHVPDARCAGGLCRHCRRQSCAAAPGRAGRAGDRGNRISHRPNAARGSSAEKRGSRVHVAGKLKQDDYDGTAKVQLHLEDAAPAEA